MSSLPDTGADAPLRNVPGWKQPWDRGRIVMITGCLMLLTLSIVQGVTHFGLPRWLDIVIRVTGYLLLAGGFGLRLRTKRGIRAAARERAEGDEGVSPRAPG